MSTNVKIVPLTPTPTGEWHAVPPVQLPPKSGEWLISFQLKGNAAQNVTFDSAAPMWVRADAKPDEANKKHPQIAAMHVTSDGKELIVLDRNNNPEDAGPLELHYRLNFDGYADLDPIIENGGGPQSVAGDQYAFATVAIVAVAALLLGMLLHWGYRKVATR